MTDKRDKLLDWLQTALELELATLPPYLVALLSIKPTANRAAAEIIRTVAVEEMLHMALVANVINAVGGSPRIDRASTPAYPLQLTFEGKPFADREFVIDLAPFSPTVLETFLRIEMPHHLAVETNRLEAHLEVPGLTIGDFYARIETLIEELDAAGNLFTGDASRQLGKDFYWSSGGEISPVTDLASAKTALRLVIDQGEGAPPTDRGSFMAAAGRTLDLGHYHRFREIARGRRYAPADDPDLDPTGEPIEVDYALVLPVRKNATGSDYPAGSPPAVLNEAFNRQYTMMLRQIGQALNGEPKALYTAIMHGMHEVSSLARQVMETTIPGSSDTACPTFEWTDG